MTKQCHLSRSGHAAALEWPRMEDEGQRHSAHSIYGIEPVTSHTVTCVCSQPTVQRCNMYLHACTCMWTCTYYSAQSQSRTILDLRLITFPTSTSQFSAIPLPHYSIPTQLARHLCLSQSRPPCTFKFSSQDRKSIKF